MNAKEYEKMLHGEGFAITYVWQDAPDAIYPEHTHSCETAHVILEGEMTVIAEGETRGLKPGDRFDVPARQVHSARMGPQGCRYVIGEREA
ncbi:MAG TPA: cupin domain-containing protein [Terriglobia bacterium]|nr:cupin domain-containing protein [Terriglobia bacterium]